MMELTIKDIADATCGRLLKGMPEGSVRGISTDSRNIGRGEMFFALKGERFDGHAFLAEVGKKGAAGAVIDDVRSKEAIAKTPSGFGVISVEDTLFSLGEMARFIRNMSDAPLIAVAGTSGKTTTKDMTFSILSQSMPLLKTRGNMNNLVGLPLTLFSLDRTHRAIVVELGISKPKEMRRLAEICKPDVAVITNIGRAHLEELESPDGVAMEKFELFNSLGPNGIMVVNLDDERVLRFSKRYKNEKVTFSLKKDADVRIKDFFLEDKGLRVTYDIRGREISLGFDSPLIPNVYNGAAAICSVLPLKVSMDSIVKGLDGFGSTEGRMKTLDLGVWTVIDDTYNANPDSTEAALKSLSFINSRKVAILGEMLELGSFSKDAHNEIGKLAGGFGIDCVVAVGKWREEIAEGAIKGGVKKNEVFSFENKGDLLDSIHSILKQGDTVLVKGSRQARMEEIVEGLKGLIRG